MKATRFIPLLLTAMLAGQAFAQANTPRIDKRQENQQRRIDNGVKSGALTAKETNTLDKREAKIEADKDAAKADGKVTKVERKKLKHEENKTSRAIYRKKHNARTAKP